MASVSNARAASSAVSSTVRRTPDLGGDSSTGEVTEAVLEKLG